MHIETAPNQAPGSKPARKPRRTAGERLVEALRDLARGKGAIVRHTERSWASITFAGTRHQVDMLFEGDEAVEAGECLIAFLPEHEFAIPGQLVADAAITEVDSVLHPPQLRVKCELLMLEES